MGRRVCFPFLNERSQAFGTIARPLANVTMKSVAGKKFDILALVDSGADVSLFSPSVARILGITIRRGEQRVLHGLGGKINAYVHRVDLQIGSVRLRARVAFPEVEVPNILGRLDVLRDSSIHFIDEKEVCFEFRQDK